MSPDQPASSGSSGRSRRGSRGGRGRGGANADADNSTPPAEPRVVGRRPGRAKAGEQAEEQATAEAPTEQPATRRRRRSGSAAAKDGDAAQKTQGAEETETEAEPARPRRRRTPAAATAKPDAAAEAATTEEPAPQAEPDAPAEPEPATPTRRRTRRTDTTADDGAAPSLEAVAVALQAVQVALQDLSERVERTARRQRLGIFVDVPNVLYGGERSEQPIDMGKLLDYLHEGRELVRATAYSPISDDPREPVERQRFVAPFVPHQYRIVTKPLKRFADGSIKGNFDVEMAIDMVTMAERLDVIAIVSGDADFARVVELVQSRGVKVEVVAFQNSASSEMRAIADQFIELDGLVARLR